MIIAVKLELRAMITSRLASENVRFFLSIVYNPFLFNYNFSEYYIEINNDVIVYWFFGKSIGLDGKLRIMMFIKIKWAVRVPE